MIIQCFSKNLVNETLYGIHKFDNFVCLNIDVCRITIRIVPINLQYSQKLLILKSFLLFLLRAFRRHFWMLKICVF